MHGMETTPRIGTPDRPLRVAIVGSGPGGFYAAEAVLGRRNLVTTCDVFDRLPTPYGLIRGGVAPDHQSIKRIAAVYERVAKAARFRFFGHIEFGLDVTAEDLRACYDAIIYATGSEQGRKLGIPGEELPGCYSASDFVGWYNGHPDHTHHCFNLDVEAVAVVGHGNVAVDVTRVLAKGAPDLAKTDMPSYAVEGLREMRRLRRIYLLGRRGPAEAAFTPKELKEIGSLPNADLRADPAELELEECSQACLARNEDPQPAENVAYLRQRARQPSRGKPIEIILRFRVSPVELLAGPDGAVRTLRLEQNKLVPDERGRPLARGTGEFLTLEAGVVFKAIGHIGTRLPGVPYDERRGTLPNVRGRLLERVPDKGLGPAEHQPGYLPGEYVVGWAKRGPTGLIGVNKLDSVETVRCLFEDFAGDHDPPRLATEPEPDAIVRRLEARGVQYVSFDGWKRIDTYEVERGKTAHKVREKLVQIPELLKASGKQ
jgi:ferredoxin/flavodoxin---NADP+ reductase